MGKHGPGLCADSTQPVRLAKGRFAGLSYVACLGRSPKVLQLTKMSDLPGDVEPVPDLQVTLVVGCRHQEGIM